MILNEVSGSLLSTSVSGHITSFPLFSCMPAHFAARHNVAKNNAENSDLFFSLHSCDDSSEPVPSTGSESVNNRLPTQKGKPARNLQVPAKGQDLTRHQ